MNELLDATVKVSVVLGVALCTADGLAKQSAALRHWVLGIGILCAAGTPWLAQAVPHRWVIWQVAASQLQPAAPAAPDTTAPAAEAAAVVSDMVVAQTGATARPVSAVPLIARVWLGGTALGGALLLLGLGRLRWLARHARDVDDGSWRRLAEQIRSAYGIAQSVRLLQSDHPSLLVTWGWRRPRILLPAGAATWPDDRIRVVLAHELAHVVRGDWGAQLAAEALRAAHWFNPLVWMACRRLRVESECACDDAVLAHGIDAPDYAAHLLALARQLRAPGQPPLPAPAMARSSSLEGRVRAMLNDNLDRRPASRRARLAVAAVLVALTLGVAGVRAGNQFYALTGTVFDSTQRVLPGVRLVLTNGASGARHEVPSDAAGRFEFVGLPPADYVLEASLLGFATLRDAVRVEGESTRDLRLSVGRLQETITVASDPGAAGADERSALQRDAARRRFAEIADRSRAFCAARPAGGAAGGNILVPRKLLHVRPTYPKHLMAGKVGGSVTMMAVIGTDGMVRDVTQVVAPHPALAQAATDAVRQWEFSTTLLNCDPIEVEMAVAVHFVAQP